MDLNQLRVMLTVAITLLVTGLACLGFENPGSAADVMLVATIFISAVLSTIISIVIYIKARKEQ
ncbi:MAG: hypothetical protein K6T83_05625 [Alicyclobacillus sp.]|nr:hypothetical protein [Alicyclobacillus sp.]